MAKSRDIAYDFIRARVLDGTFKPGERLKEEALVEQIGVSRTPIREAIKILAADNYIVVRPNSGAAVADWSEQELSDTFRLRATVEGMVARRAAGRINAVQIEALETAAGNIDAVLSAGEPWNISTFLEANGTFHRILSEAADSRVLSETLKRLVSPPVVHQVASNFSREELTRSNSHHREIIDALRTGDGDWAEHAMRTHINSAYNRMRQLLAAAE